MKELMFSLLSTAFDFKMHIKCDCFKTMYLVSVQVLHFKLSRTFLTALLAQGVWISLRNNTVAEVLVNRNKCKKRVIISLGT